VRFASDNTSGVHPRIVTAITAEAQGRARAYGADDVTASLDDQFGDLFDCEVRVFPVMTGTAANSLALSVLTPPWGRILSHQDAHVHVDECGAPEWFSDGARLVGLPGDLGKIDPAALSHLLDRPDHGIHASPASALSITQATEAGTVYTLDEVTTLTSIAHDDGLGVHMDGARFANAVAALDIAPADITWRAGIDVLSFGATKNGAMGAEAVVLFDLDRADEVERRRKRSGHLLSKMRYLSIQLSAMLDGGLWLESAANANAMARRLADGLAAINGLELAAPTDANEVFVVLPDPIADGLRQAGAEFHPEQVGGRAAARLVTSWSTTADDVDSFVTAAADLAGHGR
jgi:threonine aldolase